MTSSQCAGPRGISIEFVRKFIADHHQHIKDFAAFTTTDVCEKIVKPETLAEQCAYIDLFSDQRDGNGKPFIAKATVFVSHAWKYKFSDPVDVMEQHAKDNPDAYFWFDLFINKQHGTASVPQEWWSTTFKDSIKSIGSVLLVMSPWNNPIPVTRAWFVFRHSNCCLRYFY